MLWWRCSKYFGQYNLKRKEFFHVEGIIFCEWHKIPPRFLKREGDVGEFCCLVRHCVSLVCFWDFCCQWREVQEGALPYMGGSLLDVTKDWILLHGNASPHSLYSSNSGSMMLLWFTTHSCVILLNDVIFSAFCIWSTRWKALASKLQTKFKFLKSYVKLIADCARGSVQNVWNNCMKADRSTQLLSYSILKPAAS
jgi:hypothetical protein